MTAGAFVAEILIFELVMYNYFRAAQPEVFDDDHQFGFKKSHSTGLCTHVFKSTVDYYVSRGSHVFCCFVDFSKAFDYVDYWLLFCKLFDSFNDLKVRLIIRLLATWYNSQMVYVRWKNLNSDMFCVLTGVRQGGVLSPYLFRFYLISCYSCQNSGVEGYDSQTPLCTARIMVEGCHSSEGNAESGSADVLKPRPSLRCLPLTDIPRPLASPHTTYAIV